MKTAHILSTLALAFAMIPAHALYQDVVDEPGAGFGTGPGAGFAGAPPPAPPPQQTLPPVTITCSAACWGSMITVDGMTIAGGTGYFNTTGTVSGGASGGAAPPPPPPPPPASPPPEDKKKKCQDDCAADAVSSAAVCAIQAGQLAQRLQNLPAISGITAGIGGMFLWKTRPDITGGVVYGIVAGAVASRIDSFKTQCAGSAASTFVECMSTPDCSAWIAPLLMLRRRRREQA